MSELLLNGFEPSVNDLIQSALAQPLDRKIERAIALLRHWEPAALKLDPRGYWVADSFGKDSDCIVELAKMAGVAHHCEHNLTTLDPPELIWYGKMTRPGTHINRPKQHLLVRMLDKTSGPPTRRGRWCCEEYKERGGKGSAKVVGVRIAESARRAKLWKEFVQIKNGGFFVLPVCYWTDADVWEFHRLQNLKHCSLYDEGFKRLGCVGCPLGSNRERDFQRWPRIHKLWLSAFDKFLKKWKGKKNNNGAAFWFEKYETPEQFFKWWMEDQGDGPTCQGAELFAKNELGDEDKNGGGGE